MIEEPIANKSYGMNWKMTAKTILVQLHHKVMTFEHLSKSLVLVVQDRLLDYMRSQFDFAHVEGIRNGDPMHIHAYGLERGDEFVLKLRDRVSTDTDGIGKALGLQANPRVELDIIVEQLRAKMSDRTLIHIVE